jgi:hypothetical protein
MTTAITMTATSRRDTGQLLSENADGRGKSARDRCRAVVSPVGRPLAGTSGLFIALPSPAYVFDIDKHRHARTGHAETTSSGTLI